MDAYNQNRNNKMIPRIEFTNKMRQFYLWALTILVVLVLIGCGDANYSSSNKGGGTTGSIAFNVVWQGGPKDSLTKHPRALDDCLGVSMVQASIYDEQSMMIAQEEWLCSAHSGTISAVPAGANRTLILYGRDSENDIAYYGIKTGVEVVAGTINRVSDIVATYTVPELIQPAEGAFISSGAVVLQWSTVPGAMDYYVVYANDADFNTIIDSEIIASTSYTLTTLSADTTYYWSVWPRYVGGDNEEWGLETERRSFSTTADYTPGGTLTAPEELYTNPADGETTVTWSAVQGAEGYYLYFREAASVDEVQSITADNADDKIELSAAETRYIHNGLTNGHVYSYAVSSYNSTGESSLTAQENQIPAWSNTYKPSQWNKILLSTILGSLPSVEFGNEDWYVIDVKDDFQLIHVECLFTHADGDIGIQLYDAAGYQEDLADSEGDNEFIDYHSDYGGLYYIRVFTNGPATSYDLQWTTSLNAIAVPGDYTDLQDAIIAAADGDIIIVADGTYYPSDFDGFDFMGKAITVRSENGPKNCIIDGGGNGRGFIFDSGEGADSVLEGFTITNGRMVGWGGGGGGILCEFFSSPTIRNCIISNNIVDTSGATGGGGIACFASANPTIVNCLIENNQSLTDGGGGIYSEDASPTIINCTIVNNDAGTSSGGGILSLGSTGVSVTNTILWGNTSDQIDYDSAPLITYSNVEGVLFPGAANKNSDPLFAGAGVYSLGTGSPCIDAGTASGAPSLDIEGTTRPLGSGFDMGAYESQ
jgi:predicted outer membrane repeat protein